MLPTSNTFKHLANRVRGIPIELQMRPYQRQVARMTALESGLQAASDGDLRERAAVLRERARHQGAGAVLVEAFALAREVSQRRIGLRPYDVQLMAGLALHEGKIAEMATGEGKTLAAVPPAILDALGGEGVLILTFNDYLARRDAAWMGPIYEFFGLTVGAIQEGMSPDERRAAYRADVTYATAREAGFDFLRDQQRTDPGAQVQRPFHAVLVDEADSILVDEARIPLVIAGTAAEEGAHDAARFALLVAQLEAGTHYEQDEYARNAYLTEEGLDRVEALLGCGSLHDADNLHLLTGVNVALHAHTLLRRDVDYIVRDGRVELVDEFTGRVVEERKWPDGVQAALEAKEQLQVLPEGVILGSITLQNLIGLFPKVSGMTATAQASAQELVEFYGLRTVVIPPHRRCVRVDDPDVIFSHREAKEAALVAEIRRVQQAGRPVLVGTHTVAESERLYRQLCALGVDCQVLNARNDEAEASIIAAAGAYGAVTISTNMAGRGTDIRLGGEDGARHDEVVALGGLYVIGTNRHENRRIDDQLRGRAGRQGDPGSSRFFTSLDDDLMDRYGVRELLPASHRPEPQDEPLEDPVVRREIDRTQRIVEGQNFDIRRTLWRYSEMVERQRQVMSHRRQTVLASRSVSPTLEAELPERCAELRAAHGDDLLAKASRQVELAILDRAWADQLAYIADIREGIHLQGISGTSYFLNGSGPLDKFYRLATEGFDRALAQADEDLIEAFTTVNIGPEGAQLEDAGLERPAATWTYLINDDPFESGIRRALKSMLGRAGRST